MQEIKNELKNLIKNLYGLDFEPDVTPSPDNIPTDFSSNAPLKLAKELHNAPIKIAEELAENAKGNDVLKNFTPTVSNPGFLNFITSDEYLTAKIADFTENFEKNISSDEYSGKTVICEFSDPNPFKVLHVGHLYTSIVGDSISKLYEYAGAKVIRANFGGDVGLHVAKTMYILMQKNPDDLTIEDIAKCYVEGTAAYEDDEAAKAEITRLNKEIYKINSEDIHGTPLADLYWKGRELSYAYFNDFYARIGLKFDKYYPESTVAGLGLKTVKEQLEKGVYELSDGAVIFDGEKFGLHTRVFINKEGVPTYEAKDVGLIFTKWNDYHFDKSIVITGNEQLDYMKVVLKSVEQYAKDLVDKTNHLTHGLVKLPGNVKMSSRKGNFLKAVDVLDLINEALKSEYNSEDETVALAATKYAFLKYKMGGNIVFDPNESVKMTGNSGPYLLYSAVRAKKILEKVGETGDMKPAELNEQERTLTKKILFYKDALSEALAEIAPHRLATYLYEVAQDFSRFYEACPVAGSEKEAIRKNLVKIYLDVMTHGLNLLGINIPEAM
ncbi:MAG: arginine--tRNA ligase [Candidatus Saccharibacteria bacterium]|nr:arginine--tRNA ligase [Candidatus Saccharibacteria bacterium]